ncbi:MAG TPA: hypothetical protein VMU53_14975 [Candidatus Sulfotelmatobacter sp.]|nr:hypothetical protein [Candidatus Sulfotelmatobacter sp.]
MSSVTKLSGLVLLLLGAAALAAGARAQEPQDQQEPQDNTQAPTQTMPKPAARGIPGIDDTTDNDNQTTNWQPDTTPTTGIEAPTLGQPELGHSYWIPGFIYGSTIESQPAGLGTGNTGWFANNYIGGELSLLENWSRSQLGLNYTGGGVITTQQNPETGENGWFQQLSVAQNINLNRWKIQWLDYFSYLPTSQFGFGAGTGLALAGVNGMTGTLGPGIPGLSLSLTPNQSIYSAIGPRYSNAFGTQITYLFSPRVSVTVAGAYELLNFTQPGNISSTNPIGVVGLNYALSPTDSIGASYMFEAFHFDGEPQALSTQTIALVYTKKITKKVALNLSAGPQITSYRIPIANQTSNVGVYAGATLTYAFERSSVNFAFSHGVASGSGVLSGSDSNVATVAYSRRIGRVWTGTLNFGYSHNATLGEGASTAAASTYNDLFGGGSISRPFGRNVQLSAAYTANHENTSGTCTGPNCSLEFTQNVVTVTLQFQTRPFVLP